MAQSCDRITANLQKESIFIHIFHFTNRRKAFKTETTENGNYTAIPIHEDESHTLNLLWNFIQQQNFNDFEYIVAFGGYLPMLALPVLKVFSGLQTALLIRGNDFDSFILSARKRIILEQAIRSADKIAAVSTDKVWKIKQLFNKKVDFIPNSIDLQGWQPMPSDLKQAEQFRARNLTENKILIGIFGHLKAKKGLDYFLSALTKAQLTQKIKLLLIGEIEESLQQNLTNSGIDYQHFPFMERYRLLPYYQACNAIAIPSYYDGMPNVLLESAALGIPLIASAIDGMKDFLEKIPEAFLFPAGDTDKCAETLSRFLATSKAYLKHYSLNLIETVRKEYQPKFETKNYLQFFD